MAARFDGDEPARAAAGDLQQEGFAAEDIEINLDTSHVDAADCEPALPTTWQGAISGAGNGALIGLVFGLVLGLGSFVLAEFGPRMVWQIVILSAMGLVCGAIAGGVVGAVCALRLHRMIPKTVLPVVVGTVVAVVAGEREPDAKVVLIRNGGEIQSPVNRVY